MGNQYRDGLASPGAEEIARQEVRDWLYAHNALRSGPFTLEQLVDLFAMHARDYAASPEARLGILREELGERTMTEATAIDEMLEAVARAEAAEARNKELEQAPRFNEKKHIERMVAAGCAIDFDPATLDLIVTNERADSLSLLLREVGETLTEHEWKPCMDSTAQKIHCKRCPACRRINEHAPNCWLSALLTRLSNLN